MVVTEWTKGYFFGAAAALWLSYLAGCHQGKKAENPPFDYKAACGQDDCGKDPK